MTSLELSAPFLDKLNSFSWSRFLSDFEAYSARGGKRSIKELISATSLRLVCLRNEDAISLDDASFIVTVSKIFAPVSELEAVDRFKKIHMSNTLSTDSVMNYILQYEKEEALCSDALGTNCKALRKLFVANLRPQRLSDRVSFRHPTSLKEAKIFALEEVEHLTKIVSEAELLRSSSTSHSGPPSSGSVSSSQPRTRVEKSEGPKSSFHAPLPMDGGAAPHVAPKVCHGCGHPGHLRPFCPYKDMPGWQRIGTRTDKMSLPTQAQAKSATGAPGNVPRITVETLGWTGSVRVTALLDTGSSICLMSPKLLSQMLAVGVIVRPCAREITVASGQTIVSSQEVVCKLVVKTDSRINLSRAVTTDVTFYVLESGEDVIIGYPVLQSTGLISILAGQPPAQEVEVPPYDVPFPSEDLEGEVFIAPGPLQQRIHDLCSEFSDLFEIPGSEHADVKPMTITLKPGAEPRTFAPRRLSPQNQEIVNEQVDSLLANGIIRPSSSPYASPIVLVRRDGKNPRLCVDYTHVNACTIDLKYPLQNAKELLDHMGGKRVFASLDLKSGFHQMPLEEASIPLTSFVTPRGLFEYTRVPFGLKNAPPFFQRAMNDVLRGLVGICCEVFIDDIGVYGSNNEEFLTNLRAVFDRLRLHKLRLNKSKCRLGLSEMVYLGHLVNGEGVRLTDERKQGLVNLQAPKSTAQLRSFMGLANYMRSFVPRFAELAKPLHRLCSDKVPFLWDKSCQNAFTEIKDHISGSSILYHIDYSQPILLRTDASVVGVGGTLLQVIDGKEKPICYLSRAFSATESRWSTIEQEAFAIFFCVTSLSHYLLGHRFTIETDHRNLLYLEKSVVPKLIRWRLRLQEYLFEVKHIPGSQNIVSDALSRCFTLDASHERDLKEVHNCVVGHRGIRATLDLLKSNGKSWPSMEQDVESFIRSCPTCQKIRTGPDSQSSVGTTMVEEPFHTVAIDTVGPLPADADGNQYIIVAIDCFSRFVELRATRGATAEEAANFLIEIFGRYGAPRHLRSDQGPQFVARIIQQLLASLGTRPDYTIAYRPQSNGIVERTNGEVGRHLKAMVMDRRMNSVWSQALPFIQRILNASVHSALGTSPAKILFGEAVHLDRYLLKDLDENNTAVVSFDDYVRDLTEIQKRVVLISQEHQRSLVQNRIEKGKVAEETIFRIGDYVLVNYPNRAPSKLATRWRGPLLVVAAVGHLYSCQDLSTQKSHDYHVSRLKLFNADRCADPLQVAQVDENEFEVQSLIDHRGKSKRDLEFRTTPGCRIVRFETYPHLMCT
eukprot:ANDGO_06758.mRNA.1 Retrovirus-related Pol polyprotein from transposon 412